MDEEEGALDEHEDTLDVQLPGDRVKDAHQGREDAEDGVDVRPEHGDVRQEVVQLVGLVERVRQLLDLNQSIILSSLSSFKVLRVFDCVCVCVCVFVLVM